MRKQPHTHTSMQLTVRTASILRGKIEPPLSSAPPAFNQSFVGVRGPGHQQTQAGDPALLSSLSFCPAMRARATHRAEPRALPHSAGTW